MVTRSTPERRPVTRNDVARLAGVSPAVVSYVMNNGPKRVAPATELKVREAVRELGYRPNLAARALVSGSTRMLGLVLPELVNPFFAEFAQAIEKAAAARGHAVVMSHSSGDPDAELHRLDELDARQVDGLLVASVRSEAELARTRGTRPGRQRVPTVLLNRATPVSGFSTIGPDFTAGSRHAVDHLIGHGHRRIALVTGRELGSPVEPREQGWQEAITAAGLRPGPIGRETYTRESGYTLALRMLAGRRPPTAVFAVSDLLAIGVLRAAHELGLRLPDDLAVVSFGGSAESAFSWPPLTAVQQPMAEMATEAVTCVLSAEPPTEHHQVVESSLVLRRSCGCPLPTRTVTQTPPSPG